MCGTCGCSEPVRLADASAHHDHGATGHDHAHPPATSRMVVLERDVLAKNDSVAERNRAGFHEHGLLVTNLMSSPGSGKTTLLERTLRVLANDCPIAVVEGDQETVIDSDRLRATGCAVVQINTGAGCHLDAEMLAGGIESLQPADGSVVFVENVGNLVCPAMFDLGETKRIVIASVTEGEDKPLKYPHMFRSSDLVLLNKTDLLPHLRFDVEQFVRNVHKVNPEAEVLRVSAVSGEGLHTWCDWIRAEIRPAGMPL